MPETTLSQHHHTITLQLQQALEDSNRYFGKSFTMPVIRYDLRGQTAGIALLEHWTIRLNAELLMRESKGFIAEVPKHELAHLITHNVFGRVKPHGKEWRMVMMEVMKLAPKTTHKFAVQKARQERKYPYSCACTDEKKIHQLGIRRHMKVLRKQANYMCTRCRQPLSQITSE